MSMTSTFVVAGEQGQLNLLPIAGPCATYFSTRSVYKALTTSLCFSFRLQRLRGNKITLIHPMMSLRNDIATLLT